MQHWLLLLLGLWLYLSQSPASARPVTHRSTMAAGVWVDVVTIDLSDPQIYLLIGLPHNAPQANGSQGTYGDEPFEAMVQRSHAAAVVNGTFFAKDENKWVLGNIVSAGKFLKFSEWEDYGTTLGLSAHNEPEMVTARTQGKPPWDKHWFSLTCGPRLLRDGQVWLYPEKEGFADPHVLGTAMRSALGFTQNGKTLYLVSLRSPLTLAQEASVMKALGCYQAMNLDGGASQALAWGGHILIPAGRSLTNVIAVYDAKHPPATAVRQAAIEFDKKQTARIPLPEGIAEAQPPRLEPTPAGSGSALPSPDNKRPQEVAASPTAVPSPVISSKPKIAEASPKPLPVAGTQVSTGALPLPETQIQQFLNHGGHVLPWERMTDEQRRDFLNSPWAKVGGIEWAALQAAGHVLLPTLGRFCWEHWIAPRLQVMEGGAPSPAVDRLTRWSVIGTLLLLLFAVYSVWYGYRHQIVWLLLVAVDLGALLGGTASVFLAAAGFRMPLWFGPVAGISLLVLIYNYWPLGFLATAASSLLSGYLYALYLLLPVPNLNLLVGADWPSFVVLLIGIGSGLGVTLGWQRFAASELSILVGALLLPLTVYLLPVLLVPHVAATWVGGHPTVLLIVLLVLHLLVLVSGFVWQWHDAYRRPASELAL